MNSTRIKLALAFILKVIYLFKFKDVLNEWTLLK